MKEVLAETQMTTREVVEPTREVVEPTRFHDFR